MNSLERAVFLVMFLLQARVNLGDERFYRDTNAMDIGYENVLSGAKSTITCRVTTSNAYLAGSGDAIMATFKGSFSTSGPHSLGTFPNPGDTTTVSVTLNRVIGELNSVQLQKKGGDQWLLAHLQCNLGNLLYELDGPMQWLDVGGVEPNVQLYDSELPAGDVLTVDVVSKVLIFSQSG